MVLYYKDYSKNVTLTHAICIADYWLEFEHVVVDTLQSNSRHYILSAWRMLFGNTLKSLDGKETAFICMFGKIK